MMMAVLPLSAAAASEEDSWIKVLLSTNATSMSIPVKGSYYIKQNNTAFTGGSLSITQDFGELQVTHSKLGQIFTGSKCDIIRADIDKDAGYLTINNSAHGSRFYLGNIQLKYTSSGIQVVNHLPIQQYLYGVVAYEMNNSYPLEALKAQAVAAKCYAISKKRTSGDYHIRDTSTDQVYKGYNSSYQNVVRAVDATFDDGLFYNGKIFPTYYSASNGGWMIQPSENWSNTSSYNGAYEAKEDPYDYRNPASPRDHIFFPSVVGETGRLTTALNNFLCTKTAWALNAYTSIESGFSLVSIDEIHEIEQTSNYYADIELTVTIKDGWGEKSQTTIRYNFNLNELIHQGVMTNSASLRLFTVQEVDGGYYIDRCRYGHGVGLSQRGAQQMANEGYDYEDILLFYYPNAKLGKLDLIPVDGMQNNGQGGSGGNQSGSDSLPSGFTGTPKTAKTTGNVNFRKGPGTGYESMGRIPTGTEVKVYALNDGWYETVYQNKQGYVSEEYLKIVQNNDNDDDDTNNNNGGGTSNPGSSIVSISVYGKVDAGTLNLRSKPNTSSTVLHRLKRGDEVGIYGYASTSQDWYEVNYNGLYGYVSAKYIEIIGEQSSDNKLPNYNVQQPSGHVGIITVKSAEFRSTPSRSTGEVYGYLDRNEQVSVLFTYEDWYGVQVGNRQGYLHCTELKVADGSNLPNTNVGSAGDTLAAYGITTGNVHFRTGPSTGYSIMKTLSKGQKVGIYAKSSGWYKILVDGKVGFASADYIEVTDAAGGQTAPNVTMGTTVDWVNFRTTPTTSTKSNIMEELRAGVRVQIHEKSGDWYYVTVDGTNGYLHVDYVHVDHGAEPGVQQAKARATVRLREEPNTDCDILDTLYRGTMMTVLNTLDEWYQVEVNGETGYVFADYVSLIK